MIDQPQPDLELDTDWDVGYSSVVANSDSGRAYLAEGYGSRFDSNRFSQTMVPINWRRAFLYQAKRRGLSVSERTNYDSYPRITD